MIITYLKKKVTYVLAYKALRLIGMIPFLIEVFFIQEQKILGGEFRATEVKNLETRSKLFKCINSLTKQARKKKPPPSEEVGKLAGRKKTTILKITSQLTINRMLVKKNLPILKKTMNLEHSTSKKVGTDSVVLGALMNE